MKEKTTGDSSMTEYSEENRLLNIALAISIVLMLLATGANLFAKHGSENASTMLMILSTLGMTGIAVLSSLRHLGVQHALIYFGIIVAVELLCEQVNIMTGGLVFGELKYPDGFFGPKILDVPIAVPLAMCAINWPTYVLVNLVLFRRVVVTGNDMPFIMALFHCAILATMHTAWSYCAEPMALANEILHRPQFGDNTGSTHWGVPIAEFRGWWIMTFVQFFIFNCILSRIYTLPKPKAFNPLLESATLVMYFSVATMLLINPINADMAIGIVFTMIAYCMLAFFVLFSIKTDMVKST